MNPKSEDLSLAEHYDAFQLRDEIVVIARGKRSAGSTVALKQSEPGTDYDFSLLQHELLEPVGLPHGIEPFTAFRGLRWSKAPVPQIRVRDKSGVKMIPVLQHPEGIDSGGTELMLPLVDSSLPILRVIDHMKVADCRAVVVTFPPTDHGLFFNYQIANAILEDKDLASIKNSGHSVSTVETVTLPFVRHALFSMEPPQKSATPEIPNMVRVVSLFEEIGGAVSSTAKVCVCSTYDKNHTCKDSYPSLDAKPCPKFPPGHGTLSCF